MINVFTGGDFQIYSTVHYMLWAAAVAALIEGLGIKEGHMDAFMFTVNFILKAPGKYTIDVNEAKKQMEGM